MVIIMGVVLIVMQRTIIVETIVKIMIKFS